MTRHSWTFPPADSELVQLVELMCDGAITPEGRDRLQAILEADDNAKRFYVAYMDLHARMQWLMRGGEWTGDAEAAPAQDQPSLEETSLPPLDVSSYPTSVVLGPARVSPSSIGDWSRIGRLSPARSFAHGFSALVMCLATLIAWYCSMMDYPRFGQGLSTATVDSASVDVKPAYVGRVTRVVDCHWAEGMEAPPYLGHVKNGQWFRLESGLVEITYETGARVLLQGPVTYEVFPNGGYLASGKLVGKLDRKLSDCRANEKERRRLPLRGASAARVPSCTFAIRSPAVGAVDLDFNLCTEFGVKVDKEDSTTICVFQGFVALCSMLDIVQQPYRILYESESVLVDRGDGERGLTTQAVPTAGSDFIRQLPSQPGSD